MKQWAISSRDSVKWIRFNDYSKRKYTQASGSRRYPV